MRKSYSVNIFIVAFICLVTGLLYSRFMISLGMVFFLVSGIVNDNPNKGVRCFFKNRYYLSVSVIFLLFAISGLWSENTDYFLNRMRIKLPFLFLPYAFFAAPRIDEKKLKNLMYFFIGILGFSALWSISHFLSDFEHFIKIYGQGQILPTPIHHIRYSILISFAVLFSVYLLVVRHRQLALKERYILAGTAILLSIYLHFLAVRSGLLSLYLMGVALFLYLAFQQQYRKWAIALASTMVLLIIISLVFIPTVRNKIGYMKYSLELFDKNENIRDLSDSRRLGSIYAGMSLTKEYPILGVGIGDIMDETNRYLDAHYPELTDLELLPHNQYLLSSASLGIPAMIVFILCTIWPVFYLEGHKDLLLPASNLMFFGSFMVEHTIESQIGVAVYIFILLFCMKFVESTKSAL